MQQRIQHRLKMAQGRLGKVIQMAQSGAYCIDVIHETQEVLKALQSADRLILEIHLKTCVKQLIHQKKQSQAITEILTAFKLR